ncbi:hypothetical protein SLS62_002013 [Diatrype stigma]|uniref:Uncharacterized protein n=1 Tax=Diatrype stigma TaxID=117547 RepID=A0AAN9V134_9PEZI
MRTTGTIERLAFLAAISAPLCAAQPNAHPQFPRFLNTTSEIPSITSSSTTSSNVVSDPTTLTDSAGASSTSSDAVIIPSADSSSITPTITPAPSTTTPFPTTGTEAVGSASSISGVLVGLFPAIASWSASPVPTIASLVKSEADKVTDQLNDVLERTGSTAQPCGASKRNVRRSLLSDLIGLVSQAICDVADVTGKVMSDTEGLTQDEIDSLVKSVESVQGEIGDIAKTLPETIEEDEKKEEDQSSTSDEASSTTSSSSCSASNAVDEFVTCYSTTTENLGSTISTTTCETVTSTISGCSLEPTTSSTFVSSSTPACYVVSVGASLFGDDGTTESWTGSGYETICEWPSTANDVGPAPTVWMTQDKAALVDPAFQEAVGYASAKIWPAAKKNKCTCTDGKAFQPFTAGCQPGCPLAATYLDGYTEITSATPTSTPTPTVATTEEPSPTLIAQNFKQCYTGSENTFDQSDSGSLINGVCKGRYFTGNFAETWVSGKKIQLYNGSGDKTSDAKFTINISENDQACPEGSSLEAEYTKNALNEDVCKDHLNTVVNGCGPFVADDGPLLKGGGILYANCLSWEIRVDAL